MIQRSPIRPPARKVNLPLTTNDSNHLQKTPKKKRHRPMSKSLLLVRVIGATLVLFVVFLYIAGTRHVLSIRPSETSLPTMNDFSEILHELPKVVAPVVSHKPRSVGYYFALVDSNSFVGTERLDPNMEMRYDKSITRIYRETLMTAKDMRRQEALTHSKSYEDGRADVWSDMGEDCVPQYDWQDKSYPTCNTVMEVDMTNINYLPVFHEDHYNNRHDEPLASSPRHSYMRLITWGGWRSVWSVENFVRNKNKTEEQVVFKTQLYEHDIEERNFDRHRRDGVAMERLTASKFIMDIYAFCGNSGLFEYADGGDLETSIYSNYNPGKDSTEMAWSSEEKMVVAYQAASGLADLHNFAKEGVPAVAHTDITGDQWVYVEEAGVYKLNDFNRGRFLGKHNNTDELCTYTVGNNPGRVSIDFLLRGALFQALFVAHLWRCCCSIVDIQKQILVAISRGILI